ncbi:hypothetical protein A3844_28125 [Paenibacillus helianthi]|uniref:Uncharacterized protein n=1 Tax=Paenibacillus helianthi TaxID=1349432 RepID=A0ABX3EF89_9BACL|nr:hypothetical protein A3844_28125 [Paenibacillus helianthi]
MIKALILLKLSLNKLHMKLSYHYPSYKRFEDHDAGKNRELFHMQYQDKVDFNDTQLIQLICVRCIRV